MLLIVCSYEICFLYKLFSAWLFLAELSSQTSGSPNPNNPSEYCSVIPPSQQASARSQPPSVLVPASALKREGEFHFFVQCTIPRE